MTDPSDITPEIRKAAAIWCSRRDEGMDTAEKVIFNEWLDADERHAIAYGEVEATRMALLELKHTKPAESSPDPDLFAPTAFSGGGLRDVFRRSVLTWGMAAAAVVAVFLWVGQKNWSPVETIARQVAAIELRRIDLPDGSVVELNDQSRVEVLYSDSERRIRLLRGEAFFTVAKNFDRPFVVETGGVAVRAVGTAFSVHLQSEKVAVLVTEGKVAVQAQTLSSTEIELGKNPSDNELQLEGGYRVAVSRVGAGAAGAPPPAIESLSAEVIEKALAWRNRLLEFNDVLLAEVVAELNRYNRHQLVIVDNTLAQQRFGGRFRPDAYEAVVSLLEADFGVSAEKREGETLLRRREK